MSQRFFLEETSGGAVRHWAFMAWAFGVANGRNVRFVEIETGNHRSRDLSVKLQAFKRE